MRFLGAEMNQWQGFVDTMMESRRKVLLTDRATAILGVTRLLTNKRELLLYLRTLSEYGVPQSEPYVLSENEKRLIGQIVRSGLGTLSDQAILDLALSPKVLVSLYRGIEDEIKRSACAKIWIEAYQTELNRMLSGDIS